MEFNLIKDLSELTSVDDKILSKFVLNSEYCIGNYVNDSILDNDKLVKVDIGIGYLYMSLDDNKIKYKFVPNSELENIIINSTKRDFDKFQIELSNSMINKLLSNYKELF